MKIRQYGCEMALDLTEKIIIKCLIQINILNQCKHL